MLSRRERVSRALFPKGRGISHVFSFGTLRTHPSPVFRATVVISKKTITSAVFRHKGKRKGYEALKTVKELAPSALYVFYPNRGVLKTSVTSMRKDFTKKFSKKTPSEY